MNNWARYGISVAGGVLLSHFGAKTVKPHVEKLLKKSATTADDEWQIDLVRGSLGAIGALVTYKLVGG
jgi:hypothetical protein